MSSYETNIIAILNNIGLNFYRYGNLIVYIIGVIGNLLSIFIFLKKQWRKNVCVFYFIIYILLDLIYLNSTVLTTCLAAGWSISIPTSNVILCKLTFYFAYLIPSISPTVLILASVDRLLISSQNVDTRLYSSKRLAYFAISLSTIFWIIFNFHLLIKVNLQQLGPTTISCYYEYSDFYLNFVTYSFAIFNCLFCLLMIILSILSFKNVRHIRSVPRQQRSRIRSMTKKDFQLLRCLYIQDIIYILISILVSINSSYQAITRKQVRPPLDKAIVTFIDRLSTFIYLTLYCSSFFVFISVSKAFRHELKRSLYNLFGKNLMALREEENKQENLEKDNIEMNISVVDADLVPS